ncbi:hypothetical protein BDR26DRAFT_857316 [Obelidium mucronatum]|nr:hypothetical protein BDR26DRAFT_857316 [Obelidium mucronatum]
MKLDLRDTIRERWQRVSEALPGFLALNARTNLSSRALLAIFAILAAHSLLNTIFVSETLTIGRSDGESGAISGTRLRTFNSTLASQPIIPKLIYTPDPINGTIRARIKTPLSGCPPLKPALIGVLTTTHALNTERRNLLRQKYIQTNQNLPEYERIDVMFFFGIPSTAEGRLALAKEQSLYPHDVIVADIPETRDDGKILEWFLWARQNMYSPHPNQEGEWCPKYLYVGKGDDDSVFHLARLGPFLWQLPSATSFVGSYHEDLINGFKVKAMTGMLYLLSPVLVEWIRYSPIPRENLHGIEDVQVSIWLQKSLIDFRYVKTRLDLFHDYQFSDKPNNYYEAPITKKTIVVHYCKTIDSMKECVGQLYHNITPPSPYGPNFTRSSVTKRYSSWRQIHELSISMGTPIQTNTAKQLFSKLEKHIIRNATDFIEYKKQIISEILLERVRSSNLPIDVIDTYMFWRVDGKFYVSIDNFLAERALINQMLLYGMWLSYSAATILAVDVAELIKTRPLEEAELAEILSINYTSMRVNQLGLTPISDIKAVALRLLLRTNTTSVRQGDFDYQIVQHLVNIRARERNCTSTLLNGQIRNLSDSLSDVVAFNRSKFWNIVDSNYIEQK